MTPCSLVCGDKNFGGTFCLLIPWRWRQFAPSKPRQSSTTCTTIAAQLVGGGGGGVRWYDRAPWNLKLQKPKTTFISVVDMLMPDLVHRTVANEFKGGAPIWLARPRQCLEFKPQRHGRFNISFGLFNHNADILSVWHRQMMWEDNHECQAYRPRSRRFEVYLNAPSQNSPGNTEEYHGGAAKTATAGSQFWNSS